MADTFKFVQAQEFTVTASGVAIGATSIILNSFKQIDGTNLTMTDFGSVGYGTLSPNTSREEQISFTGITQNGNGTATLTGVKTVLNVAPYTETSGTTKSQAGNAVFVISNTAGFYNQIPAKGNDETITGVYTFTSTAKPKYDTHPTFTDDTELIDKKYADDLVISGSPDASTTVKGIVELPTAGEIDSDTSVGGTGAKLTPSTDTLISSKFGEKILVRAQATPNMTVSVPAFRHVVLDKVITFAGGTSGTITAPSVNPRIDLVVINSAGSLAIRTGTEAASPVMPTPTNEDVVLGSIYLPTTATAIFNSLAAGSGTQGYVQQISPVIYRNNIPTTSQAEAETYTGIYKLGESMTGSTTPHPVVVIDDLSQPYHAGRFSPSGYEGSFFGSSSTGNIAYQEQLAIKVIPRTTISISKVFQFLGKLGSPSDGVEVQIQSDSAGSPSNTPITNGTSSTVLASSLTGSQELSYQTFTFSTPPTLTAGTTYWFVYKRTGSLSSSDNYCLASTYPVSGAGLTYASFTSKKNRGGTWSSMTNSSLPYLEVETTGTRSLSLWKSDANAVFPMKLYYGFCTTTGSVGDSATFVKSGKLGGFSSLSTGTDYYVSNTSGTITTTNEGTYVGTAVSATEISIPKSKIQANFTDTTAPTAIYFEIWNFNAATPNNWFQKLPFDCNIVFNTDYTSGGNTEIWVNKGSTISSSNLVTTIDSGLGYNISGTITVAKGDIWTLSSHPASGSTSTVTTIKPIIN